jgi:hypothetical protein
MDTLQLDPDKVITHLRDKWGGRVCQQCGEGNWTVQAKAFELRQFHGGSLVVGGAVLPLVPVICTNCGNTVLVNAIVAGAMSPQPDESEGLP